VDSGAQPGVMGAEQSAELEGKGGLATEILKYAMSLRCHRVDISFVYW
jgi:hypothetical protein